MFNLKNIFLKNDVSEHLNKKFKTVNRKFCSKEMELLYYIDKNDLINIKKIVDDGANIHNESDFPFLLAIKHNNFELVKYFAEVGINVDDDINETMHFAIYNYEQNIDSLKIIMFLYNNCNKDLLYDENKNNLNKILRESKLKKIL